MKLIKPKKLNLELITSQNRKILYITYTQGRKGFGFKSISMYKKLIPYAYYFINRILLAKSPTTPYLKEYKRIRATDVEGVINYNKMRQIIHFLVSQKIIDVKVISEFVLVDTQQFVVNAKYFRLLPEYQGELEIIDIPVKRKPHININDKAKRLIQSDENIKHQYNVCSNYEFDLVSGKNYLEELYNYGEINIKQYATYHQYLERIEKRDIIFTISEKTDRITTMINTCPKLLRKYFLENAIEFDIQTFNVQVLCKLVDDNITITNISERILNELKQLTDELNQDFYSAIVKYFQEFGVEIDRDTAKSIVLWKWMNCRHDSKTLEYKIMKARYPEISKVIEALKGDSYDDFKKYTYKFMKAESYIINKLIYPLFIASFPTAKIYTIYDCIMVDNQYHDEVLKIMKEQSQLYFGRVINVKINKSEK